MARIDLTPNRCRAQARYRRRVRGWVVASICWAVLAGVACLISGLASSAEASEVLQQRLERLRSQIDNTTSKTQQAGRALDEVRQRWEANRSVSDQPDWGVLLALLADARDTRVSLVACNLVPIMEKRAGPAQASAANTRQAVKVLAGYRLSLDGVATTQEALSRYLIELERVGVMSSVTLIESRLDKINGQAATAFRIECVMSPAGGDGS